MVGVDGGASQNNFLMQFQADLLGVELHRPENIQTTSRGAAKAAFVGMGRDSSKLPSDRGRVFSPALAAEEVSKIKLLWHDAVGALNAFYSRKL